VISELLQTQFTAGATHKELQDAFMRHTGQKESTFDRALRAAPKDAIRKDGRKYYANRTNEGVKCQEVSKECHDISHDGVMSPPSLGDDTDTAVFEQK
jgi:hypothetical protein